MLTVTFTLPIFAAVVVVFVAMLLIAVVVIRKYVDSRVAAKQREIDLIRTTLNRVEKSGDRSDQVLHALLIACQPDQVNLDFRLQLMIAAQTSTEMSERVVLLCIEALAAHHNPLTVSAEGAQVLRKFGLGESEGSSWQERS